MKQTNERLCALAQKGDATALDSLIDNNKSFIGKVANDLFRSMNLAQAGLNLDTDDLKQAGNLGLWKAVPKFDAARGMKFLTYAAPAIRNAMMDMVRDAFAAFEHLKGLVHRAAVHSLVKIDLKARSRTSATKTLKRSPSATPRRWP